MSWGEEHKPPTDSAIAAADELADISWEWSRHPSTGNHEKVVAALRKYERIRNRPSKGFQ